MPLAFKAILVVGRHSLDKNPNASVIIRADERGLVKGFAQVLDVCKRSGVNEAKIGYMSGTAQ